MKNPEYKPRLVDAILERKLRGKGAVLIQGPKYCGKTTTAEQVANSAIYINEPKKKKQYLMFSETEPEYLLEGENPRLIDEWQLAPNLWDTVRFSVDHKRKFGLYILTGSAVPCKRDNISHTGTGRFSWLTMRPMSLYESSESSGDVSLDELFSNPQKRINGKANYSLQDIAYIICRGGWPLYIDADREIALNHPIDYFDSIVETDISRVDEINRNPTFARRLMRSYARNQGGQVSVETLIADLRSNEEETITSKTVYSYINALKKIFVIEDMEAWNPNLRSKTAIRTSDTRYFVDPSIAAASLGIGPEDLLENLETMGLFFETMAIRDLRVYSDVLDAKVYHYRDKSGLECDAVIHRRNGTYGLIEIKLGGDNLIEEGCSSLHKLANKIDTTRMKGPSFMMVVTAVGDRAYLRPDGVYVVPLSCLKP